MGATQEEVNQLVADTAAELSIEFGVRMPRHRYERGGGTPETALLKITSPELNALLREAIEVGMGIEREGTT